MRQNIGFWTILLMSCEGTIFDPTWMTTNENEDDSYHYGMPTNEESESPAPAPDSEYSPADSAAETGADSDTDDTATTTDSDTGITTDTADSDSGASDTSTDSASDTALDSGDPIPDPVTPVELNELSQFVGEPESLAGMAITNAGDINNDGHIDLLIGAPGYDNEESERDPTIEVPAGMAYLVQGPFSAEIDELASAPVRFLGEHEWDMAGTALAAGDVNGDSETDIVISAAMGFDDMTATGSLYLMTNSPHGDVSLGDHLFAQGEQGGDHFGWRVALGDINMDGCDDLAVSTPEYQAFSNGKTELYMGGSDGLASSPELTVHGEMVYDRLGYGLAFGDVDSDGLADLLIGSRDGDFHGEDVGTISIFSAAEQSSGTYYADDASATIGGRRGGDGAGKSFAVGDIDLDGRNDLLIGAPGDDQEGNEAGAAFVMRGPFVGDIAITSAAGSLFGSERHGAAGGSVDVAGDVNGDGAIDFVIGAPWKDSGLTTNVGSAYLVLGPMVGSSVLEERANGSIIGSSHDDRLGRRVQSVGDVDLDGLPDFAITAPYANNRSGIVSILGL